MLERKPRPGLRTLSRRGLPWVPFLNTYRTTCLVPRPEFRRMLDDVREMRLAA
jgi:hypothetical protein